MGFICYSSRLISCRPEQMAAFLVPIDMLIRLRPCLVEGDDRFGGKTGVFIKSALRRFLLHIDR